MCTTSCHCCANGMHDFLYIHESRLYKMMGEGQNKQMDIKQGISDGHVRGSSWGVQDVPNFCGANFFCRELSFPFSHYVLRLALQFYICIYTCIKITCIKRQHTGSIAQQSHCFRSFCMLRSIATLVWFFLFVALQASPKLHLYRHYSCSWIYMQRDQFEICWSYIRAYVTNMLAATSKYICMHSECMYISIYLNSNYILADYIPHWT